jgi:hypothetical protein
LKFPFVACVLEDRRGERATDAAGLTRRLLEPLPAQHGHFGLIEVSDLPVGQVPGRSNGVPYSSRFV